MNIIIGEDNVSIRKTLKRFLESNLNGIDKIYECNNGKEVIEKYRETLPKWVLLDVKMSPIDGLSAARKIKSDYPDANIILVSNYDDEEYIVEAKELNLSAYILKENLFDILPYMRSETK